MKTFSISIVFGILAATIAVGVETNGFSTATNAPAELLKVIDPKTGEYAYTDSSRKIIALKNSYGNILWKTNLIEGFQKMPLMSGRQIDSIKIINNQIIVFVGDGYFAVDKKTGAVLFGVSN